MICGAVIKSKYDINRMIPYDRLLKDASPTNMIDGVPNPTYKDIMKLNFRDYAHVHLSKEMINNNEPRTTDTIMLSPSDNAQGC